MSLEIEGLRLVRRDGVHLLGPLDLSLGPGDRVALVGESGSGKSLLLQALFGVLPPGVIQAGGTLRAFGQRLEGVAPGRDGVRGSRLAWVPQDPFQALYPRATLAEHLALLPSLHRGEPPEAALARLGPLLDELGLPRDATFLARRPHQVSGGQRQRICLAMALSCDPELLVLDEPTSALDGLAQGAFLHLVLRQQRSRGLGFLWVTHDLALAAAASDQTRVLYGGHLLEAGATARLMSLPRHPYTARLLQAARREPSREAGFLPAPGERPAGCPFQPRCAEVRSGCRTWGPWQGRPSQGVRCESPRSVEPALT